MNKSTIELVADLYDTALSNIFKHIYTVSANTIEGFLPAFISLYFIVMGYKWMIGDMAKGKKNFFRVFIFLPILISFIFNYKFYLEYIVTPIFMLKDYVVAAINEITTNANDVNTFKKLDTTYINLFSYVKNELMGNIITSTLDFFLGVIVLIIYGALYIWTGFYMIASLVLTSLFLMIGPFPAILFAFDSTQHITMAWIRTIATYFLFAVFAAFFMIFNYWISQSVVSEIETNMEYLFLLIVSGSIQIIFVKSIPEYVNAITGAMSSGGDAMSGVSQAFKWGNLTGRSVSSVMKKQGGK